MKIISFALQTIGLLGMMASIATLCLILDTLMHY